MGQKTIKLQNECQCCLQNRKKPVKKNINKEQEQKGTKNDKAGCFPPEFEFML